MPEIPVSRGMIGKKLDKDILSPFGGLLYQKGHPLREKDVEFLLAFKIQTISVEEESREGEGKHGTKKDHSSPSPKGEQESSFIKDFRHAVKEMEKIFIRLMAGGSLSVAEIRQWLKPLVEKTEGSTGWLYSFQENSPKNYQAYHAVGTALLSVGIARSAKLPKNEWMQIGLAGLLSDLGKVKIPSSILQKKGPLTKEEWEEVRRHPVYGFELLKNVKGITEGVILSSLQHHERLDGSGYPLNLTREKIHPYAKIVAIADVIHAASSTKPYRTACSPFQVMEQMRVEMTNQFDTGYLHTLIQSLLQLPLGTPVLLSDGRVGKILYFMPTSPLRPILDVDGDPISLMDRKELHLEKILIEYQ